MFLKVFLLFFLSYSLFAENFLKSEYEILGDDINLSCIIPDIKNDTKLYTITPGRHTRKVKSSQLITLLKKHGVKDFSAKHKYTYFTQLSPIDTSKIEAEIKKIYLQKYKNIQIKSIKVRPRAYLESLPKNYRIKMQSKNHLKRDAVVSIISDKNRQLFFDYTLDAIVDVYVARKDIDRNSELSNLNSVKKSIILDQFKAMPIEDIKRGRLQTKRHVKTGTVLTTRDIEELELVKRGANVNVTLNNSNLAISFSAKALESGVFGDIIRVEQKNSRVLKVKITGKNRGEAI